MWRGVMRYRVTRAWARGSIAVGVGIIVLGLLAGAASLVFGVARVFGFGAQELVVGIACVILGFALGAPEIIAGQLILIFLDQRDLLARIYRRLRPRISEGDEHAHRRADRYLQR